MNSTMHNGLGEEDLKKMSAKGLEDLENDRMMKNSSHGELQKT